MPNPQQTPQATEGNTPAAVAARMSELESEIHGDALTHDDGASGTTEDGDTTTATAEKNTPASSDDGSEGQTTAEVDLEISEKDVEITPDGTLVLRTDPEDPKSTFYTGKTLAELLSNVKKGIVEKDRTIRERGTRTALSPTEETIRKVMQGRREDEPTTTEIVPPDREAIEARICKEEKVHPNVLTWGRNDWNKYFEENTIPPWEQARMVNRVDAIRDRVDRTVDAENVTFLNSQILADEAGGADELAARHNVDTSTIDIDAILDTVYSDPKSYTKEGLLRHGVITRALSSEIIRLKETQTTSKVTREINKTIADGVEAKTNLPGSAGRGAKPGAGGRQPNPKDTTPKSSEDAYNQALREYRASHPKG